jgi:hypothetical protein
MGGDLPRNQNRAGSTTEVMDTLESLLLPEALIAVMPHDS